MSKKRKTYRSDATRPTPKTKGRPSMEKKKNNSSANSEKCCDTCSVEYVNGRCPVFAFFCGEYGDWPHPTEVACPAWK